LRQRASCAIIAVANPRPASGNHEGGLFSLRQVWRQNPNAKASASAEEEIKSMEQERNVAILNGDAAALAGSNDSDRDSSGTHTLQK
jgi:hypothetical protein